MGTFQVDFGSKAIRSSAGAAPSPAGLDVNCLLSAGERIHIALYLLRIHITLYLLRFLLQFAFQSISRLSYLCAVCPPGQAVVQPQAPRSPLRHVARTRGTSRPRQARFRARDSAGSPGPRAEPAMAAAPANSELQPPPSPAESGRNWIQRQQMQFPRMDVHFHYTYTLSNWW